MKKLTANDVSQVVESAMTNVDVLMAAGDGRRKRELRIQGDYKKYRDVAARQVVENAVLLAVAMEVMGPLTRRKFDRRVREVDRQAQARAELTES